MTLNEHINKYLGNERYYWNLAEERYSVKVSQYDAFHENESCYCTNGMSNYTLNLVNEKKTRQELVFFCSDSSIKEEVVSFLLTFSEHILDTKKALLRGEFVGEKPIFDNSKMVGIYASVPILWDEKFHIYSDSEPNTIFVWLIPLRKEEIDYIKSYGWNKFEDNLEDVDCDFADLDREILDFVKS